MSTTLLILGYFILGYLIVRLAIWLDGGFDEGEEGLLIMFTTFWPIMVALLILIAIFSSSSIQKVKGAVRWLYGVK